MSERTGHNGRDRSDQWVEDLLTGAGDSLGRVLDDRQRHAVCLAVEVFAYLLAAVSSDRVKVGDVIKMMKFYSKGVRSAKSIA